MKGMTMLTGTTRPRRFGRMHGSAGATAPSSARHSYVLGTMACSAGQLAEAEHHLSQALAQARRESGSRPLAALIARTLAEVYTRLSDGQQAEELATGRAAADPVVRPPRPTLALTGRETEVAHLIGKGLSNPEIAAELFISRKAVEFHLSNVYAKCGLRGRQQLRRLVGQWSSWGSELGSFSRDCGLEPADSGSIRA
jgi:DNA-binding NarL/FixJ family response regulator